MAKKPTKQQQIELLQQKLAGREREIVELRGQLKEARRRTIPLGDGKFALNFLPIAITSYETRRDVLDVHSVSGLSASVCGPVTATIIVEGALVTQ